VITTARGSSGSIKWGYRTVATLGPWSYANGTITAQYAGGDELALSQGDLVVVVPVGQRMWRWPVCSWSRDGATFTANVGDLME
jgi:hypothetical protein